MVTGGSRGIGKAIALKFAKNNYNVAISYREDEGQAKETVSQIKSIGVDSVAFMADFLHAESAGNLFNQFDMHFDEFLLKTWCKLTRCQNGQNSCDRGGCDRAPFAEGCKQKRNSKNSKINKNN